MWGWGASGCLLSAAGAGQEGYSIADTKWPQVSKLFTILLCRKKIELKSIVCNSLYLTSLLLCMCVRCMCEYLYRVHHMCKYQRTALWSWLLPSTCTWILIVKLRVARALTASTIPSPHTPSSVVNLHRAPTMSSLVIVLCKSAGLTVL